MTRPYDDDLDPELADAFGFDLEDDGESDGIDATLERQELLEALEACGRLAPLDDDDE